MRKSLRRSIGAIAVVAAVGGAWAGFTGLAGASSVNLGAVVSTNPVNFTPDVASGAVYKFLQHNGVMYAGGEFTSVSAAPGVSPGGTFARSNLVAFNPTTGAIDAASATFDGPVWALAASGTSLYVGGDFTAVNGVTRYGLAKFDVDASTGALTLNSAFDAKLESYAKVRDAEVRDGRLIIGGTFTRGLRALDLNSGATSGYLNLAFASTLPTSTAGAAGVYRFSINAAGTKLVAIGNFTSVGGLAHQRAVVVDLGPTSASVNAWNYAGLNKLCRNTKVPNYLRDVDFAPDGSYFVMVATGRTYALGDGGKSVCGATARFDTDVLAPTTPKWINYTGGDTLLSVAVTDQAVYVQGHQRWLDNVNGLDTKGAGAVERAGIGAIDPATGKALAWNPGKEKGIGGKDLYVTPQGLWVGSDTDRVGGELHRRISLLPTV